MLIMSDLKLMGQEVAVLNNFLIQLVDRIGKLCNKAKEFLPEVILILCSIFNQMPIINLHILPTSNLLSYGACNSSSIY